MILPDMKLNFFVRKIAAGLFLAAFVLIFSSCVKQPPQQISGPLPTKEELKNTLDRALVQFDSIKGFAKIEYRGNGKKKSADHVVFARYPDKLRLETLGLFGSPAMLAATDGVKSTVLLPGESVAYVGSARDGFLGRMTRLPLTSEMIVSIILRRPELFDAAETSLEYLDNGTSRLLLREGRLAQMVDFDLQRNLINVAYLADDQPISTISYSGYKGEFPETIELELINAGVNVAIRFEDVEVNTELEDARFRLVPATGYKVEPFPEY